MRRAVALAAPLGLLAGCLALEPRPDRTRYYVLEAEASPPDAARPAMPVLGLGPVRLPAYLDRRELVTRAGPGRLEVASADRWAAPLDALFRGVLAEDLRAAVPAREVVGWPWPVGTSPEWSVSVEVLRFDGEPDGTAVLEARWIVRRGGALASQGVTIARERGAAPETAATVAALSRAVGALAREIAAAVDASRGEASRDDAVRDEPVRGASEPRPGQTLRAPPRGTPGSLRPAGWSTASAPRPGARGAAAMIRPTSGDDAQAADSSTTAIPWPPPMHIVTRP